MFILNTLKLISLWSFLGICVISAISWHTCSPYIKENSPKYCCFFKSMWKDNQKYWDFPHLSFSPPFCLLSLSLCANCLPPHTPIWQRLFQYVFHAFRSTGKKWKSSDLSPRVSPCCLHAGWTVLSCGQLVSGWKKSELSGAGREVERETLGLERQDMLTSVGWGIQYIRLLQWKGLLWNMGKLRLGLFCMELVTSSLARNSLLLGPEGAVLVK